MHFPIRHNKASKGSSAEAEAITTARTLAWWILTVVICAMTGCVSSEKETQEIPPPPKMDITEEALVWADSAVGRMTLEEQIGQLLMPAVFSRTDPATMRQIEEYARDLKIGSLLLLKGDAESATVIADTLESIRDRDSIGAGYIIAVDAETGLGMRFSDAPLFPWNHNISPEVQDQTFYDYGREVGREAQLAGINMVLGPVVDVDRNTGLKGVMRMRSLGSDQLRVAELSVAYAAGLESQGVMSVAKHFPGHGPTTTDSHRGLPSITVSREELDSIDLAPFRRYIGNRLSGVMVGHIWAESLDSVKRPASFSPEIIMQLLRKEMGFNGLVVVDAIAMAGAQGYTSADAIKAGADIIIAPADTKGALSDLLEAVKAGQITPGDIRERARRVLFYKYLFNVPFGRRKNFEVPSGQLKERLHEEALPIIDSLKK